MILDKFLQTIFNCQIFHIHFPTTILHLSFLLLYNFQSMQNNQNIQMKLEVLPINFLNLYFCSASHPKNIHIRNQIIIISSSPLGKKQIWHRENKIERVFDFRRNRTEIWLTPSNSGPVRDRSGIFEGDERKRKERGGDR